MNDEISLFFDHLLTLIIILISVIFLSFNRLMMNRAYALVKLHVHIKYSLYIMETQEKKYIEREEKRRERSFLKKKK